MRLRRLKIIDNRVLGSIELDFTHNNNSVDTIILAGENGTGKSYLLNMIFELSNFSLGEDGTIEQRSIEIELSIAEQSILKRSKFGQYLSAPIKNDIFLIDFDFRKNGWEKVKITATTIEGRAIGFPPQLFSEKETRSILKSIFSDVEINFTPQDITSVTARNIDDAFERSVKSTNSLATEITQLLIDIQSADALDFVEWGKANVGNPVDESKMNIRTKRFTSAFHYMFPTKRYKRIENNNNKKVIIFEENGREMDIAHLSSGEKQIVFRGGFLLKDKESSKGAVVLIDEPEISLHPVWQMKILNFFKRLFKDQHGIQTSQLIVATHSPFIIHNPNRSNDKVIVLRKNNGQTTVPGSPKYYSWDNEDDVKNAFNVEPLKELDKPIIFVEGETDEKYFKKMMDLFGVKDSNIDVRWIGRIGDNGQAEFTGDTALDNIALLYKANPDVLKTKVILLYDCDSRRQTESHLNLLVRRSPINEQNTLYKKGIENLLTLPDDFDNKLFYTVKEIVDDYGCPKPIPTFHKNKLCDWVINQQEEKAGPILAKLFLLFMELSSELEEMNMKSKHSK